MSRIAARVLLALACALVLYVTTDEPSRALFHNRYGEFRNR